jgi:hypothetical protein
MSFSERTGNAPARPLQRGSMDGPLRNRLWSAVHELLQRIEVSHAAFLRLASGGPSPVQSFLERVWVDFRGGARDMFPYVDPVSDLRQHFYAAPWNKVYDLIEFIASLAQSDEFEEACNDAMRRERAAYQMLDGNVIELTDEQQLQAIRDALDAVQALEQVHEHLRTALDRLADRPDPDCRNAMKEAICSVESLVGVIAKSPGVTMAAGLKLIEKRKLLPVHRGLLKSWEALFGYTSDAGIRHGMIDGQPAMGLDDALHLVVTCSAIVSYLTAFARKAGVPLT